jgi:hypothetical protein
VAVFQLPQGYHKGSDKQFGEHPLPVDQVESQARQDQIYLVSHS